MRILKLLGLIFSYFAFASLQNIHEMNLSNHDELINLKEFSFLFFYTGWCDHCKILMDELEKVANYYDSQPKFSITFAKINGVSEKYLLEKYGIGEYPKMKFLISKQSYEYTGGRTSKEIIQWIQSKMFNISTEIANIEEIQIKMKNYDFFVLYLGKNNYKFETFLKISRLIDGEVFFHCFNESIREIYFGNKEWSSILIFRNDLASPLVYGGDLSSSPQLIDFILENRFAPISNFSSKVAEKIFGENTKAMFLFLDESSNSKEAYKALSKSIFTVKDKILITVVYCHLNSLNQKVSDLLGVDTRHLPIVNLFFLFGVIVILNKAKNC